MQGWFVHLKSDDTELEDKQERERPNRFQWPGTFGSRIRGRKLDNSNTDYQFQRGPFNHHSSSQNLGKLRKLAGWIPRKLTNNNKVKQVQIFTDVPATKWAISEESSHWGRLVAFLQKPKRKACISPRVLPKGITKVIHCKKAMWWDRREITHFEII